MYHSLVSERPPIFTLRQQESGRGGGVDNGGDRFSINTVLNHTYVLACMLAHTLIRTLFEQGVVKEPAHAVADST